MGCSPSKRAPPRRTVPAPIKTSGSGGSLHPVVVGAKTTPPESPVLEGRPSLRGSVQDSPGRATPTSVGKGSFGSLPLPSPRAREPMSRSVPGESLDRAARVRADSLRSRNAASLSVLGGGDEIKMVPRRKDSRRMSISDGVIGPRGLAQRNAHLASPAGSRRGSLRKAMFSGMVGAGGEGLPVSDSRRTRSVTVSQHNAAAQIDTSAPPTSFAPIPAFLTATLDGRMVQEQHIVRMEFRGRVFSSEREFPALRQLFVPETGPLLLRGPAAERYSAILHKESHLLDKQYKLHFAASTNDLETLNELLLYDVDTNLQDLDGHSPLHMAVFHGAQGAIQALLDAMGDLHLTDKFLRTPLHLAALRGEAEIINMLLEHGAKIDVGDKGQVTPLHYATYRGQIGSVRLLLAKGANADARDRNGKTALHWAACAGNREILHMLLQHGCEAMLGDDKGVTPMAYAASACAVECVSLLLEHARGTIDEPDRNGTTPLHWAAAQGHLDMAELLLPQCSSIDARTKHMGMTSLHFAALAGNGSLVRLLAAHGADVNGADFHGKTPIVYALVGGRSEAVEVLLDQKDIGVNIKDTVVQATPLDWLQNSGLPSDVRTALMLKMRLNKAVLAPPMATLTETDAGPTSPGAGEAAGTAATAAPGVASPGDDPDAEERKRRIELMWKEASASYANKRANLAREKEERTSKTNLLRNAVRQFGANMAVSNALSSLRSEAGSARAASSVGEPDVVVNDSGSVDHHVGSDHGSDSDSDSDDDDDSDYDFESDTLSLYKPMGGTGSIRGDSLNLESLATLANVPTDNSPSKNASLAILSSPTPDLGTPASGDRTATPEAGKLAAMVGMDGHRRTIAEMEDAIQAYQQKLLEFDTNDYVDFCVHFDLFLDGKWLESESREWVSSAKVRKSPAYEESGRQKSADDCLQITVLPHDEPELVEVRHDIEGSESPTSFELASSAWDRVRVSVTIYGKNLSQKICSYSRKRDELIQSVKAQDFDHWGTGARIDIPRSQAQDPEHWQKADKVCGWASLFFYPGFKPAEGVFQDLIQDVYFSVLSEDLDAWTEFKLDPLQNTRLVAKGS